MIEPKGYSRLLQGTAFSSKQLEAHFALYQGYVKKLNEILERLGTADRSKPNYSFNDYSELKRREPVAYNGTVLHELYFDALGPARSTQPEGPILERVTESFGNWDAWEKDMKAAGSSCHGWVLLVWDPLERKLKNNMVSSEHHVGLFANSAILLALDVWEHAYAIQFGMNKSEYLAAYFDAVDWDVVGRRFEGLHPATERRTA